MKHQLQLFWKKSLLKVKILLITYLGKGIVNLLMATCKIQVKGSQEFDELAKKKKCILMLWHNRIAITPYILSKYTNNTSYAAVVSASRDGELLSSVVNSYKRGKTIKVGHQSRYQALRELIHHIKEDSSIAVITPDGPRGPRYEMKPGIALAALETQALAIPFDWEAQSFWELGTWDRLRLPKPFSIIHVTFGSPVSFESSPQPSLNEAIDILKKNLRQ